MVRHNTVIYSQLATKDKNMKYVHLENNKILGWYDEEINPVIPTPNIEITEEQWQEALNINANCYENGNFIHKDFRTDEEIQQALYNQWKDERQSKVDNIEVELNGIMYQGDETSQTRIARVVSVMEDTDTIMWVAKDNNVNELSKADLKYILREAGIKQTLIWNDGRQ